MPITLTTPVAFTIAGVTETNLIAVASTCMYDFQNMIVTVVYKLGPSLSGSPLVLVPGPAAQTNGYFLTVTFNLNTGVWSYTYGPEAGGGTLTGAPLTTQQTNFISLRNELEGFVSVSGGLLPGTQVNWTAL